MTPADRGSKKRDIGWAGEKRASQQQQGDSVAAVAMEASFFPRDLPQSSGERRSDPTRQRELAHTGRRKQAKFARQAHHFGIFHTKFSNVVLFQTVWYKKVESHSNKNTRFLTIGIFSGNAWYFFGHIWYIFKPGHPASFPLHLLHP